ncbi:MAG: site-specific integrase [Deltaproteobacteria bacterium]|nr:site-specific integrase [Deltaproteobacteria bacterium]
MSRRKATEFEGVRYRSHPSRKHGIKNDQYFSIRYRVDGKRVEEGLGWASKGMTAKKAALQLAELQEAHRKGTGEPVTLREKRKIARAKRGKQEKQGITFGDYFINTFIPQAVIEKPRETKDKKSHYEHWIKPVMGALPFPEIGVLELERVKTNMLTAGKAPRTIQYVFSTIRRVWNDAKLKGIVSEESPTRKIKLDRFDNKRARYFTHDEAEKFLTELKKRNGSLWDMALVSLQSGLRFSEIANLRYGDIDLKRNIIGIRDSKGGFSRYARMTEEVRNVFSRMEPGAREALIFHDADGMRIKRPSKIYMKVIDGLGFNNGVTDRRQRLTYHSLRHTYASWLVDRGVGLYDVQKLLGHKNSQLTERYSHLSDTRLDNDVREFEKGIKQARRGKVVAIGKR